jgi:hypothetical protein
MEDDVCLFEHNARPDIEFRMEDDVLLLLKNTGAVGPVRPV